MTHHTDKANQWLRRTSRDRDEMIATAKTTRLAIGRALSLPDLTPGEAKVFLAVLMETATWTRIWDRRSREDLAQIAGVSERTVSRALDRLSSVGAVTWIPARGRGALSVIGLAGVSAAPGFGDIAVDDPENGTLPDPQNETAHGTHNEKPLREENYGDGQEAEDDPWAEDPDEDAFWIVAQAASSLGFQPSDLPNDWRMDRLVSAVSTRLRAGVSQAEIYRALLRKPPRQVLYPAGWMWSTLNESRGPWLARAV